MPQRLPFAATPHPAGPGERAARHPSAARLQPSDRPIHPDGRLTQVAVDEIPRPTLRLDLSGRTQASAVNDIPRRVLGVPIAAP